MAEYKQWEAVYIKLSRYGEADRKLDEVSLKKLLFMAFIVRTNLDVGLSSSFSSDLVIIHDQNTDKVLDILSQIDFLIPSTCYYLDRYFRFEDKNTDKKIRLVEAKRSTVARTFR